MLVYYKPKLVRQLCNIILLVCLSACHLLAQPSQNQIIPAPVYYQSDPGYFYFRPTSFILVHDMQSFNDAIAFRDIQLKIRALPLKTLKEKPLNAPFIDVRYDSLLDVPDGGYKLVIHPDSILIIGKNAGGAFYGLMTLAQLIESPFTNQFQVPCATITDYPKFEYRGMHLDCSRHFFSVDEIKQYIDYLALYKMNTFHWHLTDDQGWRIEIKKYPKLTEVGAWRDGSMTGHYREQKFDSIRYGGYYTQGDITTIVKYAERRNITIIPEIEMPGHCKAALAAYPELGCIADTTYTVGKQWGIYPEAFCPKEETFTFLEDVLTEVMALFPGKYIHIGGDEVMFDVWKSCAHCQQLMQSMNTDAAGLQSYFVKRMDAFVHSQGKNIIGWDEIIHGGISDNATIMSWRGEEGCIQAVKQGHDAIMTPTSHCYFDYYQGYPSSEPLAIGGYVPLSKVYAFQPVPSALTPDEAKHVLGAQANLWSEYLYDFDQVEYMLMPRLMALSEVLWSPENQRNYDRFLLKVQKHFTFLDAMDCRYSTSAFNYTVALKPIPDHSGVQLEIQSWNNAVHFPVNIADDKMQNEIGKRVFTTIDYEKPIQVTARGQFDLIIPETKTTKGLQLQLQLNKATGKPITLQEPPSKSYPGNGAFTLVDGEQGTTLPSWSGMHWLGFSGTNATCVIDLLQTDTISSIGVGTLTDIGSWIWPAKLIEVQVSMDGRQFTRVGVIEPGKSGLPRNAGIYKFAPTQARYIQITVYNYGDIPAGNPGAGHKAWLFIDEISVE